MPGEFVDSNVLLYLTSTSSKSTVAGRILDLRPTVSVQVLNEMANVISRKFKRDWSDVERFLAQVTPLLDVHPLTQDIHRSALLIVDRYKLSWWDALIVSAALSLGCDTLYSEDMHDGLVIDGQLTIVNPFAQTAD